MINFNKRPRTYKQMGSKVKVLVFSTEERFAVRLRELTLITVPTSNRRLINSL